MIKFSGSITYILPTDEGNRIRFEVQGMSALTKGLFDYIATPDWQTVWRLYDDKGQKLWEDARHHSIMPGSQADSAIDDFGFEVDKSGSIYTFQLFGRISGETQFITQQAVDISTNSIVPTPAPVPVPPTPTPVPLPPSPVPLPEVPDPEPWDWEIPFPAVAGISAGVLIAGAIILFLILRK